MRKALGIAAATLATLVAVVVALAPLMVLRAGWSDAGPGVLVRSLALGLFSLPAGLGGMLLLGLPAARLLSRRGLTRARHFVIAGSLLGCVPFLLFDVYVLLYEAHSALERGGGLDVLGTVRRELGAAPKALAWLALGGWCGAWSAWAYWRVAIRGARGAGRAVIAVSRSATHSFSKETVDAIRLVAGLGVEGDAHAGATARHRSRVAASPSQPSLRQVHLIHAELHDELRAAGFDVAPGQMGENVTTRGIDLLGLPAGTRLRLGASAIVEVTGLRNPCDQLDRFRPGLQSAVLYRDAAGRILRKAGVMGVVVTGGVVRAGDPIDVVLPPAPHRPLAPA